jgi:superfamily I DNA/RNA helicase
MSRDYVLQPFQAPVDLQIDYAKELNAQQHAAVTAAPGPALVIAGAGSGKTRTLTYRVAYLLEHGVPADRILLLTFTNKAAREMMRRVADLLGSELQSLWGGTFHSIGARLLRRHAEVLGFRRDFTILDREDASDLIKTCIAEAEIDIKATRFPKADVLSDVFSKAVNTRRSVAETVAQEYDYFSQLAPQIEDIAKRFTARKRAANVMEFDDLLVLWLKLLADHEDARELYQRRFQFILVDEYQDTNKLQSELIDLLAARHKNLMVVGDDSQSIYAWRGANFRNILEFPKRYPDARIYKIETNYRSTPEILSLANAAIAPNAHQFAKQLTPARKSGIKPVLVTCNDGGEQASFVAQRVLELREEGESLNRMAVLYRSHFHALELQLEFTRRNIPFSITSGIRFFEQAHIKDVAAYLKLVSNPTDELAFKRLVQMLPGVGGKGAEKLWQRFGSEFREAIHEAGSDGQSSPLTPALSPLRGEGVTLDANASSDAQQGASELLAGIQTATDAADAAHSADDATRAPSPLNGERAGARGEQALGSSEAASGPGDTEASPVTPAAIAAAWDPENEAQLETQDSKLETPPLAPALQRCAAAVPKKSTTAWAEFVITMSQLEAEAVRSSPSRMIQHVIEAGYEDYLQDNFANYRQRLEDLEQLASFALQFKSTEEFLTQLSLLTNVEAEDNQATTQDNEQIKLSTIHQAKGLEFDVVFVIMLCDGLFPSSRSIESADGEEEERRLFYVAITRARNELYLSYPLIRVVQAYAGDAMQQPSRFLKEFPPELVDEWNLKPFNPYVS